MFKIPVDILSHAWDADMVNKIETYCAQDQYSSYCFAAATTITTIVMKIKTVSQIVQGVELNGIVNRIASSRMFFFSCRRLKNIEKTSYS